jgi:hypothetical protein
VEEAKKKEQIEKAVEFWNQRIDTVIQPDIDASHDQVAATFKWGQLVWQEVVMFISLGKVKEGELDWLNKRRGFNEEQRIMLYDILVHVGLLPQPTNGVVKGKRK